MRLNEIDNPEYLLRTYKDQINFAIGKYKKGICIFRGSATYLQNVIYTDPTTRTTDRTSANTYNYYTLWLDNDKAWSKYPKRGKSLICSTNYQYSLYFGNVRIVVPLSDCKIGICSNEDIWNSFNLIPSLRMLVEWINGRFSEQWPNEEHLNISYLDMMQKLKQISSKNDASYLEDLLKNYDNAEVMLHDLLAPTHNNFKLTSWKQFNTKRSYHREVWLSTPCLLIYPETFKLLVNGTISF